MKGFAPSDQVQRSIGRLFEDSMKSKKDVLSVCEATGICTSPVASGPSQRDLSAEADKTDGLIV